ncbi:MAG TPA: leucyl aminopeptidase family protein [Kiloniellaceae bacterium]|nr:leucyl aminopeptidase family protein [Kiloniellaceae bacterium]
MTETLLAKASAASRPLLLLDSAGLETWRKEQSVAVDAWLNLSGFKGQSGSFCPLPDDKDGRQRFLAGWDPENPLWSAAALAAKLPEGSYTLTATPTGCDDALFTLGWRLGSYSFDRYKDKNKALAKLVCPAGVSRAATEALAEAVFLTRDLINTPANDMGPAELAAAAATLAERHGAKVKVTVGERLLKANYPAIHAVGRASSNAPRLIDLAWGHRGPKVTLVGKGVCFDSGGLDLKSAAGMLLMKKDMGGGAHVLGLAAAVMAAKLPLRLRVLVPAVENAVSGNALRPGDIIATRKGLSVEIGNTDAEGRLVLADALAEACRGAPDLIVDFATLTGAARVALGTDLPALFCNDETLAAALLSAGLRQADPLWRLPLHRPYRRLLDSPVADMNNVSKGGYGGAITAALFLESFVDGDVPWAHIDLMAWNLTSKPGRPEGGEAMGLRAAFAMLADYADKSSAKGGGKARRKGSER